MVEKEAPNDEGKSHAYLSIPQPDHKKEYWEKFEHHFKLALHGSQYVIRERMSRASRYPDQNLAKKICTHIQSLNAFFFSFYTRGKSRYAQ